MRDFILYDVPHYIFISHLVTMVRPSDNRIYCISKLLQLCKKNREEKSESLRKVCMFISFCLSIALVRCLAVVGTDEEKRVARNQGVLCFACRMLA